MKRFKNILFVSDKHGEISEGIGRAVDLAMRNETQLTVLGVVKISAYSGPS